MTQQHSALVHGAGPTGALAALALADAGWSVRLRDPLSAEALCARSRAYAFNHSSRGLLTQLGLWQSLSAVMVPFRALELHDQGSAAGLPFGLADLGPRRAGEASQALGWIGLHQPLMTVLLAALAQHPAVDLELACQAAQPPDHPADLEVAADGGHSPRRAAAGIGVWRLPYRQSCLTVQVELRGEPATQADAQIDARAWELFRPEGPLAVLPLGGGRFQVVWSAPGERCRSLEQLDGAAFLDRLAAVLPLGLEPDRLLDIPRSFAVELLLAHRLRRGTLVLVGESAHRCHPVGGQGLNLCWRDVAELHRQARRVARGRLAASKLPAAYGRRRWPDLVLTLVATDLLVRLFSNRHPLLLPVRRAGLALLKRLTPLRVLSLALMTDGLALPW